MTRNTHSLLLLAARATVSLSVLDVVLAGQTSVRFTDSLHAAQSFFGKLTGSQLVKKFPAFYGRQSSLPHSQLPATCPYTEPARSSPYPPHPTSRRSILILSSHLHPSLPSGLFTSGFPTKTLYTPLLSPMYATLPTNLILLGLITRTILGEEYKSLSSSLCSFLLSLATSFLLGPNILNTLFSWGIAVAQG